MPTPDASSAKITADQNSRLRRGKCKGGEGGADARGASRGGAMRGPVGELRKEAGERSLSDKLNFPSKPHALACLF
jgi:hypothetical protein